LKVQVMTSPPLSSPATTPVPPHPAARVTPVRMRRVVDAPTRVFHALFALTFLGAYLTAEGEAMRLLHVTLGYTLAGLLVFRVVYGLVGPRHARLSLLWRKLTVAPAWLASVKQCCPAHPRLR
jgi:cytochrome b